MSEKWKDIFGYEGAYQVSDAGRVRSLDREVTCSDGVIVHYKGKILKPFKNNKGQLTVSLCNGTRLPHSQRTVHQLVAEAFIDNPDDFVVVKHIDGDIENCAASNLKWAPAGPTGKLNTEIVRAVRKARGTETEIARQFGLTPGSVNSIRAKRSYRYVV